MRSLTLTLCAAILGCGPGTSTLELTVDATTVVAGIAKFSVTVENLGRTAHSDFPAPGGLIGIPPARHLALVFDKDVTGAVKITVDALGPQGQLLTSGMGTATLMPSHATSLIITLGGGTVDGGLPDFALADMAMCGPDFGNCPSGCKPLLTDVQNCGQCGNDCTAKNWSKVVEYQCTQGLCGAKLCAPGYLHCTSAAAEGCETEGATVTNCGSCGNDCTKLAWSQVKSYQCSTPGDAGVASCAIKTCETGFADCTAATGCETDTTVTVTRCGGCGNDCNASGWVHVTAYACAASACQAKSCETGYAHCSNSAAEGCEVNTQSDPIHCGACSGPNAVCPFGVPCKAGVCTKEKVLVIGTSDNALLDVANKLTATNTFASVATYNAGQNGFGTPTVVQLQMYAGVLVFSDSPFADAALLGNNLADYYDSGGRVVTAPLANAVSPVSGKFGTVNNGYMLLNPLGQDLGSNQSLGTIHEAQSSLLMGVNTLSATIASRTSGGIVNGGISVADWSDGKPLIVRGVVKSRNRVDLNLFPPSKDVSPSYWIGDGANILRNALVYK